MPTPFYHLSVAEDLLTRPGLSSEALDILQQHRPAFLLGNTAPDVQTVSGQERQVTHFFDLPIFPGTQPAWERLLARCPSLVYRNGNHLPQDQAAFLAGYLCPLQADWLWVLQIFAPVFGPHSTWQTFSQRLYLHNVLRAYLDQHILRELPSSLGLDLAQASPSRWLPFVQDSHLREWRDLLAQQLRPGASVQTVEVFAARQGIAPDEYYRLLASEERLDQEIFARLPRRSLEAYRRELLEENTRLLNAYLVR
ncbi:MAG TPA: zinc dependent phospholipase C family protein [Anaerolineales bacterium]